MTQSLSQEAMKRLGAGGRLARPRLFLQRRNYLHDVVGREEGKEGRMGERGMKHTCFFFSFLQTSSATSESSVIAQLLVFCPDFLQQQSVNEKNRDVSPKRPKVFTQDKR